MLPLFKDNTLLSLGHLLSRSLEPADRNENTGNPETNKHVFRKTLSHMCAAFK